MISPDELLKPNVSTTFVRNGSKIYILKNFYDFSVNDDIYYSINMVEVGNSNIILYSLNRRRYVFSLDSISFFKVHYRYEKVKLNLIRYLLYMGIYSVAMARILSFVARL